MIAPESWKRTCLACKKDVTFGEGFKCPLSPRGHRVESKRYYHMGGRDLQHPREKAMWAPTLMYTRGKELRGDGQLHEVPALEVQFAQRGLLDTESAEVQFYLETNSQGVGWGELGRKNWENTYYTPETREAIARATTDELERKNKALREENSLLEQTKARGSGKKSEVA